MSKNCNVYAKMFAWQCSVFFLLKLSAVLVISNWWGGMSWFKRCRRTFLPSYYTGGSKQQRRLMGKEAVSACWCQRKENASNRSCKDSLWRTDGGSSPSNSWDEDRLYERFWGNAIGQPAVERFSHALVLFWCYFIGIVLAMLRVEFTLYMDGGKTLGFWIT